jgi:hypothetical protein
MGRVDDGSDALADKKCREAVGAAEAPDALRNGRPCGIGGRSRQRQDCGDVGLIGDPPRERAGFRRPSEDEQTKAIQCAAP